MKARIVFATALAALMTGVAALPSAASKQDQQLVIGARFDLNTGTGTFAACCVVNDSGTAQVAITSFTPMNNDTASFEATNTFNGTNGSFTIALRGTTGPLSSQRHIAHGEWRVVSGSGGYASLKGHGRTTAVTDETTGALTAIDTGDGTGTDD
jgi:hypothetical protein